MSLSAEQQALKQMQKPDLKYNLGDTVFLKSDLKKRYPMQIINFKLDDYNCSDYYTTWLNSQGTQEHGAFPEECLIKNQKTL